MKRHIPFIAAAALFTAVTAVTAVAAGDEPGKQTRKNLEAAMHGEAYAHLKYLAYADKARSSGQPELARAFEDAANVESGEHFAREAERLGLADTNGNNILDAMAGEHFEFSKMYLDYARQAEKEGDKKSAELFRQIAADEQDHFERFKQEGFKLGEPREKETGEHEKEGREKS